MQFSTFAPCKGNASFCGVRILAQGIIQRDSGEHLAQFLANPRLHKNALPPVPTVVFDSPGGNIVGAMSIGRVIRRNRMDTEIGTSYSRVMHENRFEEQTYIESPQCASACVLEFVGGISRSVQPEAKIGVHQFAAPTGNVGDGATQVTMVVLASYLDEMGVERLVLDRASTVPPKSMHWLSQFEARLYNLDNTAPAKLPWRISALPQGDAILEVVQTISAGRTVFLRIAIVRGVAALSVTTVLNKSAYHHERIAQFPVGTPSNISLCTEHKCFRGTSVRSWNRSETDSAVHFQILVALAPSDLSALSKAKRLSVDDGFGTASADISLNTDLSISGFSSGIALLLRIK